MSVPVDKVGTLAEVEALDAEMRRRTKDDKAAKVTTVLLANPHNPLGAPPRCHAAASIAVAPT